MRADSAEDMGLDDVSAVRRATEIASLLGEHSARINTLERRVETEVREIRDSMRRIESSVQAAGAATRAAGGASPDMMLAVQALNRVADSMSKPAASPPLPELLQSVAGLIGGGPKRSLDPVGAIGYVLGAAAVAWVVRGLFGV